MRAQGIGALDAEGSGLRVLGVGPGDGWLQFGALEFGHGHDLQFIRTCLFFRPFGRSTPNWFRV